MKPKVVKGYVHLLRPVKRKPKVGRCRYCWSNLDSKHHRMMCEREKTG